MQCFKLGGFLATIENSKENTYIINQLKAYKSKNLSANDLYVFYVGFLKLEHVGEKDYMYIYLVNTNVSAARVDLPLYVNGFASAVVNIQMR